MANRVQILDKIERNLEQIGLAPVRNSAEVLTVGNLIVRYENADIASPMGGVSDAASPFLGIGTANPGVIAISGLLDADAALADLFVDANDYRVLARCTSFANDVILRAGDTATATDSVGAGAELARLEGHPDLLGLGQ